MRGEAFVKLYGTLLLGSSLMEECVEARWLFVCLLSAADGEGFVRCQTPGAVARLANLTEEQAAVALKALAARDRRSTSTAQDGRRILRRPGGWEIVNYHAYREMRTASQVKKAVRQARWRASTRDAVDATGDAVDARETEVSLSLSNVVVGEKGGVGGGENGGPRSNPLIGDRVERERELNALVRREAALTDRDGAEVMAEVATYHGAKTSKLNPAAMSDDRLLNSLLDARARVKRLEVKHGRA